MLLKLYEIAQNVSEARHGVTSQDMADADLLTIRIFLGLVTSHTTY